VRTIVEDLLVRHPLFRIGAEVVAGVGIAILAREVAGCYVQSDPMAGLENVAGRRQVDDVRVGATGLDQ
jgi:hypothetical protein